MLKKNGLLVGILCALSTSAVAAPIKVGIALDISGPFSALGEEARAGFELAIETLGGKLGGQEAEFIQTDFAGNPQQASQLVNRYIKQDKIDFFTGPIASNAALAVGQALFAAKVPFVSSNPGPSQYAGAQCNPYFFGVYQNDTYDEVAGVVANDSGYKKMVIIAPNYPAGKDHLGGFKRTYKGEVAEEIYTRVGQLDYAAELAQIRSAEPDAVFFFLPGAMGINFIKQFKAAGLDKVQLVAPGFSADQDVINAVGEAMVGLQNTAHWTHDLDNATNKKFVADYRQKYNRYPAVYAAQAYDVIMSIDAAVRDVKGDLSNKEALIAALRKAEFDSVRGPFTFGVNHYPIQDYYLRVVEKNAQGDITNKLVKTVMQKHQDAYVNECKMP